MSGVPWFRLDLRVGRWHHIWTLPPRWWMARACRGGRCAYDNFWCPNGCPEHVDLDEPIVQENVQ